jgi:UDP-N-acetylmuramoyl-tripeptide--D-alanyl-D-alanine ligase
MNPWTKAELAEITGGVWEGNLPEGWATNCIAFWNALIAPGALVIPHVRTYRYGVDAANITRHRQQGIALLVDTEFRHAADDLPLLRVPEVRMALRSLAKQARAAYSGRLIAVTGSVGKTSTTAMINTILTASSHPPLPANNWNTFDGVHGHIANLPSNGIRALEVAIGFLRYVRPRSGALLLKPHVALITTIGDAHLEEFGSRKAVAELKSRLYNVAEGGTALIPRDSEYFDYLRDRALSFGAKVASFGQHAEADYRLADYAPGDQMVRAVLNGREFVYKLTIPGRHMAVNSLGALASVDVLGLELGAATDALGTAMAIDGRGKVLQIPLASGTAEIIDEAYNANPTSVAAALEAFADGQRQRGGRSLALLGDMLELGPQSAEYHAGLAKPVLAANLDMVMTVGEEMKHLRRALPSHLLGPHYATATDVLPDLIGVLRPGDRLLMKASNGTKLYEVVARVRRQLSEKGHRQHDFHIG